MTDSSLTRQTIRIPARSTMLTGWGRTAPTRACLLSPSNPKQVEAIMSRPHQRGLIARGLGRSYGDPAQNAGGMVVDMTAQTGIHDIDLASGRVIVDSGVSLDRLMRLFVPMGWFVPVTPGTRYVTVGGAIACDIHGKNHHLDGSFARHVTALDLLTPAGTVVTVDPDHQPDLFWATAGGMGMTGIILRATVQLLPIETSRVTVDTKRMADLDEVMTHMTESDQYFRYSVAWLDTLASGASLGRSVLYQGNHTKLEELSPNESREPLRFSPRTWLSVPDVMPDGLIRPATVAAFNELWFQRNPEDERGHQESLEAFFHQLDMVLNVNRLYGNEGFLQHQCVVPLGEEETLRRIIERLSQARCPSFLVVLKRMSDQPGMLSFPMAGWTLAVDIPTGFPGLHRLLDELDEIIANAGGRLYLAKDSRMRPELLPAMYPRLEQWRETTARLDPNQIMQSDLARRLQLR